MLVGITGYAGSGKDTAAQALLNNGFERRAFADPMRTGLLGVNPWIVCPDDVVAWSFGGDRGGRSPARLSEIIEEIGWDEAKRRYPEVRRLQQTYGTEGGRYIHGQQCWIKAAELTLVPTRHYVFTDVRFPNERDFIHQQGGLVIRICRDGVGAANTHSSEQVLDDIDVGVFNNSSVEDLHDEVLRIVADWYPNALHLGPKPTPSHLVQEMVEASRQRPIHFGGVRLPILPRVEDDHEERLKEAIANEMSYRIKAAHEARLRGALEGLVRSFEHVYGPLQPPPHEVPMDLALKFYADRYPDGNGGTFWGEQERIAENVMKPWDVTP